MNSLNWKFVGNSFNWRAFLYKGNKQISPWHDLLLKQQNLYTFVVEIPYTRLAKLELSTSEAWNPIKQDTKTHPYTKEKVLRYYAQFPLFNYGFLPQTWEDNSIKDVNVTEADYKGDGDPLDVVELGSTPLEVGSIVKVKVIGSLCLIDQGEVDWKILAIRDGENIEQALQKVDSVRNWFERYKVYDGKKKNTFAFKGELKDVQFSDKVISNAHQHWKNLVSKKSENYWLSS